MRKIEVNWLIKYGFLTGDPRYSGDSYRGETTISLCGIFWRAVRTTLMSSIALFLLGNLLYTIYQYPKNSIGMFFILVGMLLFIWSLGKLIKAKAPQLAVLGNKLVDKILQPAADHTTDFYAMFKEKFCPLYRVK